MMTLCPSEVRIPSARMRAIVSVGPPAAKGTTMTTGRVGKVWADAPVMAAAATSAVRTNLFMDVPVVGKAIARGRHPTRRRAAGKDAIGGFASLAAASILPAPGTPMSLLRLFFSFRGRAGRGGFWLVSLAWLALGFVL